MTEPVRRPLDFVVIGASKSGTTSLFRYLDPHPQIYIPPSKEAPFFCIDDRFARGWEAYLREFFHAAPQASRWGTVSPQYMEDVRVPQRMATAMPKARLIALLRHPVDRARSAFLHNQRKGVERRGFDSAVAEDLEPENLERARRATWVESTRDYLVKSEYGRILGAFRQHFPGRQLQVLFTDDLERQPQATLDSIGRFVGIDPDFTPANLGKRFHVGGQQRFPWLLQAKRRSRLLSALWNGLPQTLRARLWLRFHTEWNTRQRRLPALPEETRQSLVDFYRPDIHQLEKLLEITVPWSDFQGENTPTRSKTATQRG